MSDFSKTTNFTAKDALTTGDPNKVIKGSEFDTEFDNLATSSATKANKIVSGAIDNVVTQTAGGDLKHSGYSFSGLVGDTAVTKAEIDKLDGATASTAELNHITGVTSAIQTQLNTGAANLTNHAADTSTHGVGVVVGTTETQTLTGKTYDADAIGNVLTNIENANVKVGANIDAAKIGTGVVSNTEFNYVNGVTSAIQTQLNAKAASGANSDITSLTGLTTDITIAQGGTGASTAADARANLGAAQASVHANNANGNPNVSDTLFDVVTNVTVNTWESVGATGSGATNIWTALDSVPTDVDWIEVKAYHLGYSATGTADTQLISLCYIRKNGGTQIGSTDNMITGVVEFTSAAGNARGTDTNTLKVGVAANIVFDVNYSNTYPTMSINLVLTGYGYNS